MTNCPHCNQPFELVAPTTNAVEPKGWTNVARIANVAEAGYLAVRLQELDIAARVVELPSFSAVGGDWRSGYVLQVDGDCREAAVELLAREAEEVAAESEWDAAVDAPAAASPTLRVMSVVALAGFAGFWAGTHTDQPPAATRPSTAARLATDIESIGEPLVVHDANGNVVHRVTFDRRQQALLWQSDGDGDGRWDRTRLYPLRDLQ